MTREETFPEPNDIDAPYECSWETRKLNQRKKNEKNGLSIMFCRRNYCQNGYIKNSIQPYKKQVSDLIRVLHVCFNCPFFNYIHVHIRYYIHVAGYLLLLVHVTLYMYKNPFIFSWRIPCDHYRPHACVPPYHHS